MISFLTLIGTFGTLLFFVASLIMWFLHRRCAYHVDTGFWTLVVISFGILALSYLFKFLGVLDESNLYTFYAFRLVGLMALYVAVARLFTWVPHTHTVAL